MMEACWFQDSGEQISYSHEPFKDSLQFGFPRARDPKKEYEGLAVLPKTICRMFLQDLIKMLASETMTFIEETNAG